MKLKTIQLKNYKKHQQYKLRQDIIQAISSDILDLVTEDDFIYISLTKIRSISNKLLRTEESIVKAINKIRAHFGESTESGDAKIYFFKEFMMVGQLPGITYRKIEKLVHEDLLTINQLIKGYEANEYVQKLISDDEKPRNHEEKILHDFYKRCLAEREIILNYYLTGIKDRARAQMEAIPGALTTILNVTKVYRDRPYHFWLPYRDHFYDASKIDGIWHRLVLFEIKFEDEAEQLYKQNKRGFYRKFFQEHPVPKLFQTIAFYLGVLPLNIARKPIFDELKYLFEKRKWIGFYALALTQIEGLFSEIYNMINGMEGNGKQALPDKVQSARKHSEMSDYYFDYYQYQLPRLRNKFMHAGYDTEYQLKSYDVLLDLIYLMKAIHELKNAYVKINNIHKARKFEDFISHKDFGDYFKLIDELKPSQKEDLKQDLQNFEAEFLKNYCNTDYISNEVIQSFPPLMDNFTEDLKEYCLDKGIDVFDLSTLQKPQIDKLFKEDNYKKTISRFFRMQKLKGDEISNYNAFLSGYKKHLPSLAVENSSALEKIVAKYKVPMRNFVEAHKVLSNN